MLLFIHPEYCIGTEFFLESWGLGLSTLRASQTLIKDCPENQHVPCPTSQWQKTSVINFIFWNHSFEKNMQGSSAPWTPDPCIVTGIREHRTHVLEPASGTPDPCIGTGFGNTGPMYWNRIREHRTHVLEPDSGTRNPIYPDPRNWLNESISMYLLTVNVVF